MGYSFVSTEAVIVWLLIALTLLVLGVFGPVVIVTLIMRRYYLSQRQFSSSTRQWQTRPLIRHAFLVTITTICVVGPVVWFTTIPTSIIDDLLDYGVLWMSSSAIVASAWMIRCLQRMT